MDTATVTNTENVKLRLRGLFLAEAATVRVMRRMEREAAKKASWKQRNQRNDAEVFYKSASQFQRERMQARNRARCAHLARAYVKGQSYHVVEQTTKTPPNLRDIYFLLLDFNVEVTKKSLKAWFYTL